MTSPSADSTTNEFGQPVGLPLPGWSPPPFPARENIEGRYCRLEPLEPEHHATDLHLANSLDAEGRNWTYLPIGPFDSLESYRNWMTASCLGTDPMFFAVVERGSGKPYGVASFMRIAPAAGSIEVGHIHFSEKMKRTPLATEAMYRMMKKAFDLGYRRYEWKCDALNAPSRAAAARFGFRFEGVFRQATVYKGRSRDTAWFSIIDSEWPAVRKAFETWLDPGNFDDQGKQRVRLAELTQAIVR
jgi:RimJ/RimL family protein N-acetyltransferase